MFRTRDREPNAFLHPCKIAHSGSIVPGPPFKRLLMRFSLIAVSYTHLDVYKRQVNKYVSAHRLALTRGKAEETALWVSSTTGRQMTAKNLGTLISKLTRETIGVDVSPYLFRTAAASTAAVYGGKYPYLASALLGHRDPRVNEEHYNLSLIHI